jgi:hypothetical protein
MSQYTNETSSSTGRLVASWALVAIPLAWGVYHTLLAAGKLFGL